MHFDVKQSARAVIACILVTIFAVPGSLMAQAAEHVVSPADLRAQLVGAAQARQHNLDTVRQFLSSERAQKALRSAHMNPEQVTKSVASLSDAELAQLAARADKAQANFAAGTLDDRDLILIILAIAALILIIVAVR
ncbi:MAG TPA: PA2779 family protein [Terriglobales bacterium]|nr:PA2779 family protein [Terriglobales bacterium]